MISRQDTCRDFLWGWELPTTMALKTSLMESLSGVKCSVGLEWTRWKNQGRLFLMGRLSLIQILGSDSSFILRLTFLRRHHVWRSSSLFPPTRCRVELGIEPRSFEWRASVSVCKGVRNLQPTDECECRHIFTAVRNLGQLESNRCKTWCYHPTLF